MADTDPPSHPTVEALLEAEPAGIVEVTGYPRSDDGPVRIYRDLSLDDYLDIPEDAVLRISEPEDEEASSTVYFDSQAEVTYATRISVSESASYSGSLTVVAEDVKRTARGRRHPARSGCSSGSEVPESVAVRREVGAGPGDPGLPPMWCELNCEQWLNSCLSSGQSPFWCWVDYYLCRLGCIYRSSGDGVVTRT